MINLRNQVPSIYTSASRDFQYLSWLINIVLNSVKHNVDDLYDLPNTKADPRLTELLAMTLGFKVKRNYDQKQLATLVSILPTILKYKGTIEAITLAGNALIRTAGSEGSFHCELEDNCLIVRLPRELVDTTLFMDLLPYILPAGLTCRIVRRTDVKSGISPINVAYQDALSASWHVDLGYTDSKNRQITTGLANLYEAGLQDPNFAFFENFDANKPTAGLLDNSLIPVLDNPIVISSPNNTSEGDQD